jgi:lipoprotein-releasing system permease protein
MIHKIAIASIGIGLAIMIISFLILKGFQLKIQEKIFSFDCHLQVTKFTLSRSYEEDPISRDLALFKDYSQFEFVDHIQEYANKAGLLKANEEVMGVVLKGVSETFDLSKFEQNITQGQFPDLATESTSNEIMISQNIADKLSLGIGDETLLYFIQNPPRVRKMTISGIYETGMEDFDDKVIMGDLRLVQRMNNWSDSLVGGFEIFLKDYNKIDKYHQQLEDEVGYELYIEKISDKFAEIFDWLSLLNRNVVIFLSLTLFVACFNMISILLILIMERTHMIGVLKSFGSPGKLIRRIFIYNGMGLIAKGMILGNLIGILFGFLQSNYQFLTLDAKSYYMEFVPISWDWPIIIFLNVLTFAVVSLTLSIPTMIINRITPIKSIRFD